MGEATEATIGALNRHLARVAPGAVARRTDMFDRHRIDFPDDHGGVLIVIPTKNRIDLLRPCVESIRASTAPGEVTICVIDHESDDPGTVRYLDEIRAHCMVFRYEGPFNYARMNNAAIDHVATRRGGLPPYLLFANNDVAVMHEGWLERMRSLAARPDVGAVGASLLYGNETYQHSGVILGFNGGTGHAHRFQSYLNGEGQRDRGYLSNLVATRDYSAVTAACLMLRTEVFRAVGGFDEQFAVAFNDTDLCLRIGARGLKIIKDGDTILHHYESATRKAGQRPHAEDDRLLHQRWGKIIQGGDPFYNPLLSRSNDDHRVERYGGRRTAARVRPGLPEQPPAILASRRGPDRARIWLRRLVARAAALR